MGAEAECLILFFGGLGVCYLLVGGWRWHGAKSCLGPAEIQSNVFGGRNNCLYHIFIYKSYMHGHFYFCRLIGNIAICSNCSAQFYKSYVPGYFYFSQLSYIVSVLQYMHKNM